MRVFNFDLTRFNTTLKNKRFKRIISNRCSVDFVNLLTLDGDIINLRIKKDKENLIYGSFSVTKRGSGEFFDILTTKSDDPYDSFYVVAKNNKGEHFIEKQVKNKEIEEEFEFKTKEQYLENLITKQKEIILLDSSIVWNGKKQVFL